jgi:hypothetical protein
MTSSEAPPFAAWKGPSHPAMGPSKGNFGNITHGGAMRHLRSPGAGFVAGLLVLLLTSAPARAGFVLSRSAGSPGADNVIFGEGSGNSIVAEIGKGSGVYAEFASAPGTTLTNVGQSGVSATSGTLTSLSAVVQGSTFSWMVFNASGQGPRNIGPATLTVETNQGTFTFDGKSSVAFTLDQGSNFFQLKADGTTTISKVTITISPDGTQTGFDSLKQVGFGGVTTHHNPAPPGALLALAGAGSYGGYAGLAWLRRCLRSRRATSAG